jgi:hypothetical protein
VTNEHWGSPGAGEFRPQHNRMDAGDLQPYNTAFPLTSARDESESCRGKFSDDLPDMPHNDELVRRNIQSHVVPDEPRQREQRVLELPYESIGLLGVLLYDLPRPSDHRSGIIRA